MKATEIKITKNNKEYTFKKLGDYQAELKALGFTNEQIEKSTVREMTTTETNALIAELDKDCDRF